MVANSESPPPVILPGQTPKYTQSKKWRLEWQWVLSVLSSIVCMQEPCDLRESRVHKCASGGRSEVRELQARSPSFNHSHYAKANTWVTELTTRAPVPWLKRPYQQIELSPSLPGPVNTVGIKKRIRIYCTCNSAAGP